MGVLIFEMEKLLDEIRTSEGEQFWILFEVLKWIGGMKTFPLIINAPYL